MPFYNPYHFIPVERVDRQSKLHADRAALPDHVRHDRYVQHTHSGRIVCTLTTVSPTFVGARRTTEPATGRRGVYEGFAIGDRPAIPRSSLRGCVGSILEAATNSALRVLHDAPLSHRRAREHALSAIGIVDVMKSSPTGLGLLPLVPPFTLDRPVGGNGGEPAARRGNFISMFGQTAHLRVYVGDRVRVERLPAILDETFPYRTFDLRTAVKDQYYGMSLPELRFNADAREPVLDLNDPLVRRHVHVAGDLVLAQLPLNGHAALPEKWNAQAPGGRTRGIMRVLGSWGRQVPPSKRHELFLPFTASDERRPLYPLSREVCDRFHSLADERYEATKDEASPSPFEPRDTRRNTDPADQRIRLKPGDIVYFAPSPDFTSVVEVAFSSIWRALAGSVHDFFRAVDPELLPMSDHRTLATAAELVMGFVSETPAGAPAAGSSAHDQKPALVEALAGRIRFSHAVCQRTSAEALMEAVPLKVLASPKPPSPSLYFKSANGQGAYIAKDALRADAHHPQGRKQYLHQTAQGQWRTSLNDPALMKMQSVVNPIRDGQVFWFHVDFENLSDDELAMLCYAISPSERFLHKIGMGKALGLGSVRIRPAGLFLVERADPNAGRYSSQGFFGPRYTRIWGSESPAPSDWPAAYARESACLPRVGGVQAPSPVPGPRERADGFAASMSANIRRALTLLGESVQGNVHVPLSVNHPNPELETFKWFVNNDRDRQPVRQFLRPLAEGLPALPTLEPNQEPPPPGAGGRGGVRDRRG